MSISRIILIVTVCFLISTLMVPIVKKIAYHIGALDIPDARKVHTTPMPRLGGLAIFTAFLLGYMLFATPTTEMNSILIGSFIVFLTGMLDDIKPLPASIKFGGQLLGALTVVFYGGIVIDKINIFSATFNLSDFAILNYGITLFLILGCMNCINLIDGLDGLSSGVASIFFITIGIIGYIQGTMSGLDITLAFIMLGATLGFLLHNFHPAKIFMGDSGTLFVGFIIGVIAILGFKNVTVTSLITPLLILAIPIMDTLFAIIRRLLKGQPISKPDKFHIHHQLLNLKISHVGTVLIIYLINILFALSSIIYVLKDETLGRIVYAIILIIVIWFVSNTSVVVDTDNIKHKLSELSEKKHKK